MNAIKIEKMQITEVPQKNQKIEKCVAFQKIKITYIFYGKIMVDFFDTKILKNGKQIIINGNGYFNDGYEIK